MRIKTSKLEGVALDWAVAQCEGWKWRKCAGKHPIDNYSPSGSWAQGGPIIEREGIELTRGDGRPLLWVAFAYNGYNNVRKSAGMTGPTPLIAAMRCYVALKLCDEVEIPEALSTNYLM